MKILVVLPRVPFPIEKGDKLRAYNFIREMSKNDEIHLFAIDEENNCTQKTIDHLGTFCKSITVVPLKKIDACFDIIRAFFNGLPLQIGYFYSKKINNRFLETIKTTAPDHIACQLVRTAEYVKNINIPKSIDIQDTMSLNMERRSQMTKNPLVRFVLCMESKRLLKYEHEIFDKFDDKTLISRPDRDMYPHENRNTIHIIPNGVNFDYFCPREEEKKFDIVFTGNMGYNPNVNGSMFLVKEILPILLKSKPDIKILIAGANPPKKLKRLESANVHVTGWVEDIRDCYAQSKIFIAPMRIGTGLQNKLLEAMAMKIPCITTPLANESLGAKSGVNILVAKGKQDLADNILTLLNNKQLADAIAQKGFDFVKEIYSWEKAGEMIHEITSKHNCK